MKLCLDKLCDRSGELLPFSDFPKNKITKDGRAIYCRLCCQRRTHETRARIRAKTAALKALRPERKPMIKAPKPKPSDRELIVNAIRAGARTRTQIKSFTGLHWDIVTNTLADLCFDFKQVRIRRVNDEALFELVKAA